VRRLLPWLPLLLVLALGQGLEAQLKRAEDLKAQRAREAARLEAELKTLDQKGRALVKELRGLEAELARLGRELRTLDRRRTALQKEIARLAADQARREAELAGLKTRLAALLVRLWKTRAGHWLPVLSAGSFTELAVKTRWLADWSRADLALAEKTRRAAEALGRTRAARRALLAELERTRAARAQAAARLARKRARLKATLAQLERTQKARKVRLAELYRSQKALDQEIAKLKKALEAQKARAALAVPKALVGRLLFPVAGGRVLARYGQDGHDFEWIGAPRAGAPVRAAGNGQVFAVLYYGNVGWTVMLQHSERLFTQYVNLQEPPVATGDHVRQGEVIGYLGGGALIPPNVLWFRVALWKNGRFYYVNPDPYF